MKDEGWLFTGNALIRSVLHMNPDALADDQWAVHIRMAEWTQNNYLRKLGGLFSG